MGCGQSAPSSGRKKKEKKKKEASPPASFNKDDERHRKKDAVGTTYIAVPDTVDDKKKSAASILTATMTSKTPLSSGLAKPAGDCPLNPPLKSFIIPSAKYEQTSDLSRSSSFRTQGSGMVSAFGEFGLEDDSADAVHKREEEKQIEKLDKELEDFKLRRMKSEGEITREPGEFSHAISNAFRLGKARLNEGSDAEFVKDSGDLHGADLEKLHRRVESWRVDLESIQEVEETSLPGMPRSPT